MGNIICYNSIGEFFMKILGLDYGEARIGVAISDALGMLANPLDTICEKDREMQLRKTAVL